MNSSIDPGARKSNIDWLDLIKTHGRGALVAALVATAVVAVAGGVYVRWGQLRQVVASLEFRPTFKGLEKMKYPNELPFAPDDVTDGSVIDAVYDRNQVNAVCNREVFRGGFFVEQRSDESVFLDLEYQARLSEPRITSVERKLLQEEHAAKRKALPLQYRLVFVMPEACAAMPPALLSKVMVDVLGTWASDSEIKRGVLRHQIEVLTPATLDVTLVGPGGLLLRTDLLRTALQRVITNVAEVEKLPGAMLIRLGPERVTFAEIEGKLRDLVGSKLDPLVMTSGRSMAKESAVWVVETVAAAERKQRAAEQKAAAFQTALRGISGEFEISGSGRSSGGGATPTFPSSANPSTAQALVPQLDASFINRVIDMSEATVRYRQGLADSMVLAQLEAVAEEQRASYYRRLLQSFNAGNAGTDVEVLTTQFNDIVAEGKALTKQFGDLYEEFSRVALRSSGAMYEIQKPLSIEVSQQFSTRLLLNVIAATFLVALVLALGFFAVRTRMSQGGR